mgnify:CR=1 FL=1
MARYTGPKSRIARKFGEGIFGADKVLSKKNYPPGQHGNSRKRKTSEYGIQLREKQKVRRTYGLLEKQFAKLMKEATRQDGLTGVNLLRMLEQRLDNAVYRAGFATSRRAARQLVSHGHFTVNGRKLDIPSALLKPGDVIAVAEGSRDVVVLKENSEAAAARSIPAWLSFNAESMTGTVVTAPIREQIEVPVNEQLVVEFYAR